MRRLGTLLSLWLIFGVVPGGVAASKITPGSVCKKVNQQALYKNRIYNCIKLGKKLYWDNGTAFKVEKPTPLAPDSVKSNPSPIPSATNTPCETSLPIPIITVTPKSLGYQVAFTKPSSQNFDFIEVAELISESQEQPSLPGVKPLGWRQAAIGENSPLEITKGDRLQRWVTARFTDSVCGATRWSNLVKVTPVDPVLTALDTTPPQKP